MINVIAKRKLYLAISGILVLAALLSIGIFRFKEGIDFKGGTMWNFKASGAAVGDIQNILAQKFKITDGRISDSGNGNFLLRLPPLAEAEHKAITDAFKAKYPGLEELSFSSIGPSVGTELRYRSMLALGLVLIGISLYIAFAFRKVFQPISSWKYGWVTLITLLHDVAIPAGLLAVLGHFFQVEIDSNFIVALLVVMGFSVHDTIVVFDRIRENLLLDRGRTDFGELVNKSVNQTMARSINTSLTLILVLLALYFAGPATLKFFVLTLLVGVTTGIYSSIFVASPLLYMWQKSNRK